MKKKNCFSVLLLPFLVITMTSGIYRHDQPVEKYLALANQKQFDCVGQVISLKDGNWQGTGSFVLIDSVTILSAAHCFMGELKKDTVVNYQGQKYKTFIVVGKYKRDISEFHFLVRNMLLNAKNITLHSNYLKDGTCDIAIIKLEKPIRGVETLKINNSPNEIKDTVTGVGFGVSGPANKPELVNIYHLKLAGQNIIDSVGGPVLNGMKTVLYADFDDPDSKEGCNKTGNSKPLELEYSIGAGDSGGPLFSFKNNKLCLTGIAVYAPKSFENLNKNGYYCTLNGWTRISAFEGWIKENK